jgi:flagellar assembly protein FliH
VLLKEQKIKGLKDLKLPTHLASLEGDRRRRDPMAMLTGQLQDAVAEIERLQAELVQVREERFQEGFTTGEQQGFVKGVQAISGRVEELGVILDKMAEQQSHVIKSAEQFVVDFCFRILTRIVGEQTFEQLQLSEARLREMTETAINEFSDSNRFVIRVHKGMADTLEQFKQGLQQKFNREIAIIIQDDPSLKPGDCLIEADYGVLDARIESQLSELKEVFSRV